ncbi:MAG TPA: ribosome silencing factor [Blastocatellia bacterium]|nr:ribosome silencing factor [Blastocatellia bacterium]
MVQNTGKQVGSVGLGAEEAVLIAARAASEKKASEIVALDLRKVASFTDYFLLSSGSSSRQVQAIADSVEEQLRAAGRRPLHTEGYGRAEWILLDYGDFVVHTFSVTARRFYDLERLWRDSERVELPANT